MIEVKFGEILKKIRIEKGLSQHQLALHADLDRTYISLLERGLRTPTLATLFKISSALGIAPHKIVIQLEEYEDSNQ